MRSPISALCFSILILSLGAAPGAVARELPVDMRLHLDTIQRKGVSGDNWCQTWAADDNIYTMMDDGSGWKEVSSKRWHMGSKYLRIRGGPDFTAENVEETTGWPQSDAQSPLYGYGTVSVDGVLYVWVWKSQGFRGYSRPVANRLLYSRDLGKTFFRWNGEEETTDTFGEFRENSFFFYKEDPRWTIDRDAYAFNWIAFCQNGRDNSAAKDDYVYMYSPEQHDPQSLGMIRVHKDHILDRAKYEFFRGRDADGTAQWTPDMQARGVALRYPDAPEGKQWMWASWHPSVVYNPGLDLYIMASYGVTDTGKKFWDGWCWNCSNSGSLGFWYAESPAGPWTQFYYTDEFRADRPENRTYQPKLSPKWISEDGKRMVLIWSDAGDDHTTNYLWNQMEIELVTK